MQSQEKDEVSACCHRKADIQRLGSDLFALLTRPTLHRCSGVSPDRDLRMLNLLLTLHASFVLTPITGKTLVQQL